MNGMQRLDVQPGHRALLGKLLAAERLECLDDLTHIRARYSTMAEDAQAIMSQDEEAIMLYVLALDRGANELLHGRVAFGPDLTPSNLASILTRHAEDCAHGLADRGARRDARQGFRACVDLLGQLDGCIPC